MRPKHAKMLRKSKFGTVANWENQPFVQSAARGGGKIQTMQTEAQYTFKRSRSI